VTDDDGLKAKGNKIILSTIQIALAFILVLSAIWILFQVMKENNK